MTELTPPGPGPDEGARAPSPTPYSGYESPPPAAGSGHGSPYGGYSPYAHDRPPASRKMAGWALGLSLAFCIPFAFLVAIGLAIAVLVKSADGRDHGKGMAIAALIISGILLLANIVYVVVIGVDMWFNGWDETERDQSGRVIDSGKVSIDRLRSGDCVSDFQTVDEVEDGAWSTGEVTVVPCADPHVAEVFEIYPIDPDDYADQASLDEASVGGCLEPFRAYVGRSFYRSTYDLNYYNPSVDEDTIPDDSVVCMVTDPAGSRDRMIKGSRR